MVFALAAALAGPPASGCRQDSLPIDDSRGREVEAGRRIYEAKCASCHNKNGDGRTITAGRFPYANLIDGKWRSDGSPAAIEKQVRRGHDPMPKFEGKLTNEEIRDVVAYVMQLSHGKAEGAAQEPGSSPK
jgi:mono/diheme cytochrome c family protein